MLSNDLILSNALLNGFFTQQTIQTPLPAGITTQQASSYQIRPSHLANVQSNKEEEQRTTVYRKANGALMEAIPAGKKFNSKTFADKFHAAIKDQVTGYALQLRLNGAANQTLIWAQTLPRPPRSKSSPALLC